MAGVSLNLPPALHLDAACPRSLPCGRGESPSRTSYQEINGWCKDNYLWNTSREPISVSTDEQAVDDGTLVDLTQFTDARFRGYPINRMARPLFEQFKPILDSKLGDAKRFGYYLRWFFRTKFAKAQAFPDNVGWPGDIYSLSSKIWLVRNEIGGWTAMYPQDY